MHRLALLAFVMPLGACSSPATAQPKPAQEPLYEIDTAPQPAPAAGSHLDRILKSLHVRICVRADVPPFGYFQAGALGGFDVALATEIVDQLSIDYKTALKPEWVIVAAADRIKRVQDDGCDLMVAAFSYTKDRASQLATSKVYIRTDKVLVAAKKITRKTPVIAQLEGATGAAGVPGTVKIFRTYQEIVHAMDMEEIDYLATDRPIAEHLVRSTVKAYAISKTLAPNAESYVAGVRTGNTDTLAAVDRALDAMARSGRLALIDRRWL
jgi:ABC-type amino acid transport substrate-binding protein